MFSTVSGAFGQASLVSGGFVGTKKVSDFGSRLSQPSIAAFITTSIAAWNRRERPAPDACGHIDNPDQAVAADNVDGVRPVPEPGGRDGRAVVVVFHRPAALAPQGVR